MAAVAYAIGLLTLPALVAAGSILGILRVRGSASRPWADLTLENGLTRRVRQLAEDTGVSERVMLETLVGEALSAREIDSNR